MFLLYEEARALVKGVWPHKADFILKIRHSKKNSIKQMPSTWLTNYSKKQVF